MKKLVLIVFCMCLLVGCASQPHSYADSAPGFFMGIWHGYIAIVALIIGFFTDVRIYNFPNSGYWYDVGFVVGLFSSLGTAASAA